MTAKKAPNPVDRILASLDESPEIESYAIHEIEGLPIEEVRQRLDELGVDNSLPRYIKSLTDSFASPAQKVFDALDHEVKELSPEDIEHLPAEEVKVRLNSLGLNYVAGVHKIRELTRATSDARQDNNDPRKIRRSPILTRLRIGGAVAALARIHGPISGAKITGFAAVAATAVLAFVFIFAHWGPLEDKWARSEREQLILRQLTAAVEGQPDRKRLRGAGAVGTLSVTATSFEGDTSLERAAAAPWQQAEAPPGGAQECVRGFYNVLLGAMKDRTLGKSDRYEMLASIVERTFDLPFMAKLVVGQSIWVGLPPAQQQKVTEGLRRYIAATYTDNFASYSGEELRVTGERQYGDGAIVQTKIVQSNGETNFIDYLMHHNQGSWKISDAYVDGAVSELAKLRAEFFRPILQREGVDGLIRELNRLAA
jgi:hopanoid biosynthesis associated membrane protein HpnM